MHKNPIPIIAIDGTSSSGKGTIARRVAKHFGYHYLNSGALYRLTAYTVLSVGAELTDKERVIEIAKTMQPHFEENKVIVDGVDIWPIISTQEYSNYASIIAVIPEVREAVFEFQRSRVQAPGLVAEGRDMCTVVFTDAHAKLFLDADLETRAERRFKDEQASGSSKTLEETIDELRVRDHRDMTRAVGPLFPAEDATIIDTTSMTIQEVLEKAVTSSISQGIPSL